MTKQWKSYFLSSKLFNNTAVISFLKGSDLCVNWHKVTTTTDMKFPLHRVKSKSYSSYRKTEEYETVKWHLSKKFNFFSKRNNFFNSSDFCRTLVSMQIFFYRQLTQTINLLSNNVKGRGTAEKDRYPKPNFVYECFTISGRYLVH